ncbi:MAG: L-serine ammonia-lyase, iron-sulfur-dependent subunit beta [Bacillota bacterium]
MSIFEVMGPIMIGPSSSHTAGAVKLGRMARLIFSDKIEQATIYFHGSFAETHRGHGTDRAVIGGILGFSPDDQRIKSSMELARDRSLEFSFGRVKLQRAHPNSLKIVLGNRQREVTVVGSSLGGGEVLITGIDEYEVNISGKLPTLWVLHRDQPGEISMITRVLGDHQINIAFMHVFRNKKGQLGSSIIEVDQGVGPGIISELEASQDVFQVRYLPAL